MRGQSPAHNPGLPSRANPCDACVAPMCLTGNGTLKFLDGQLGGGEIFDCGSDTLEEGDGCRGGTAGDLPADQLTELPLDVRVLDHTGGEGLNQLSGLAQRARPRVDIERRPG